MHILSKVTKLREDEAGATVIEYAFVAGLISLALFGAISNLGDADEAIFGHVSSSFTKSVAGSL